MSTSILSEPEGMSSKEQFSHNVMCELIKMQGEMYTTSSDDVRKKVYDSIYYNLKIFDGGYSSNKTAKTVAKKIFNSKRNRDNTNV